MELFGVKSKPWQSIAAAFSIVGFLFVVLPVQTYLNNPGMFGFGMGRLIGEMLVWALVGGILLSVLLCGAGKLLGGVVNVMAVALLACLYLESGLFSIGIPPINGELSFCDVIRGYCDLAGWMLVFLLFFLLRILIIIKL